MRITQANWDTNFKSIRESSTWNNQVDQELKMHKIHMYPAKFPSFLIGKSLEYARKNSITVNSIGDIFCGCGTTALEAKVNDKEFWGCDINPVATLIAKVKRETYSKNILNKYYENIVTVYTNNYSEIPDYIVQNDRILYWFWPKQIEDLSQLLNAIKLIIPKGKYQDFFLVAFSNILKRSSKWLTKSIKPQIDPAKPIYPVFESFKSQYITMLRAVEEINTKVSNSPNAQIINRNFLRLNVNESILDMLITSPPYVTSYEYADLHQLSTMWLGYTNDFRELRNGTIGSIYNQSLNNLDIEGLDEFAIDTYRNLSNADAKSPRAALKYFIDMRDTINKSYSLINPGGMAVFVIGNTTYKDIYIDNAKYLTKCMLNRGFGEIEVMKRKISSKILSPYRDKRGKFSNNKNHKKIYSYEFVIIARKPSNG
ncbi:class I SAM-dependent methyltransferase [Flavobacterium filum]|uniref:class I SAM-dependent methyltransferase n=1 Tax=Flavobacterium filum TaxID=370974 RepID=UPI00041CDF85|nr:class I SAM-dependent methyltransferase [Flavobacterium filum]